MHKPFNETAGYGAFTAAKTALSTTVSGSADQEAKQLALREAFELCRCQQGAEPATENAFPDAP